MEYSILIVDDQPENIKIISSLLREMKLGKKIYSAPNGEIALKLVKKYTPDLIITDWEMPVMNGIDLVKNLKNSKKYKDIPIIMVTAVKTDDISLNASFEAGVHDYLKKPFNKLEFSARVKATLKFQSELIKNKEHKLEIEQQSKVIGNQNKKLLSLNKLKDKFISIISHDTKAPLLDLDGILSILTKDELAFDRIQIKEYFGQTHQKIKNLISFLNNILFWSKSHIDNVKIEASKFNSALIVEEILMLYKLRIEKKKIIINNNISPSIFIKSDKELFSFLVRNLIDNAIKFTPEKGQVSIDSIANKSSIQIDVKDNGVGMEQDKLDEILSNKNINTSLGTNGEIGTGMGLNLCKELADQKNWDMKAQSKINFGTKISLVIPLNKLD